MKRRLLAVLLTTSVAVMSITACKKDSDAPGGTTGITKEKLVGKYRITEIKQVTSDGTEDILAEQSACDRDNFFELKSDMSAVVIDAGETCSPSSDDTGSWEYKDAKTVIINGTTFTIKSLEGSTLKMSNTETYDNEEVTLNVTYVKQ